jgi:Cellulase N-terminal ig-like domain
MVPPKPRLPLRRLSVAGWAVGLASAIAGMAVLLAVAQGPVLPPLKNALDRLRGYPAWLRRAALGPELSPFGGLAASQVGYGPSMAKQFSSPTRFTAFQVVSSSGEVALQGGQPVREVSTDALGAVQTVWVGDFTPLGTPGRYRIITNDGISSYPFDVGPRVFDSAVRAVQRAFYYQRAFSEIDSEHAQGPWVHATDAALAAGCGEGLA